MKQLSNTLLAWNTLQRVKTCADPRDKLAPSDVFDVATALAHDLNNLLSAFVGYGALIYERAKPESAERGWAEEILDASDRATTLVRWFSALSRPGNMMRRYELSKELPVVRSLFRKLAGAEIRVELDVEPNLIVQAYDGTIERLLTLTLIDARQRLTDGGGFHVRAGWKDERPAVWITYHGPVLVASHRPELTTILAPSEGSVDVHEEAGCFTVRAVFFEAEPEETETRDAEP